MELFELGTHQVSCYATAIFEREVNGQRETVRSDPVLIGTIDVDTFDFDQITGYLLAGDGGAITPPGLVIAAVNFNIENLPILSRKPEWSAEFISDQNNPNKDFELDFTISTFPPKYSKLIKIIPKDKNSLSNISEGEVKFIKSTKKSDGQFRYLAPIENYKSFIPKEIAVTGEFIPKRKHSSYIITNRKEDISILCSRFSFLQHHNIYGGRIREVNKKYKLIPLANTNGNVICTLSYSSNLSCSGLTTKVNNQITVKIGPRSISNESSCASTIGHEAQHVEQFLKDLNYDPTTDEAEKAAYRWELRHAGNPKISSENITNLYFDNREEYLLILQHYENIGGNDIALYK